MPTYGHAPTSNLRVQLAKLRSMIGEPFDYAKEDTTAPTAGYWTDMELMDYIHRGEMAVVEALGHKAIPSLLTSQSRTTVDGTNTYTLPGMDTTLADEQPIFDFDALSIELDAGAGYMVPCEIRYIDDYVYQIADNIPQRSVYRPLAAVINRTQIIVSPTPGAEAGADKLIFRYVKLPRRRYRQHHGIASGGGASSVIDLDADHPNGFWTTDCVATLRLLDTLAATLNAGVDRVVTDWDTTTGTFTLAFPLQGAPASGAHYLVGECSDLDDALADYSLHFAAHLALLKDKDPTHALQLQTFKEAMAERKGRRRIRGRPHVIPECRYGDEW